MKKSIIWFLGSLLLFQLEISAQVGDANALQWADSILTVIKDTDHLDTRTEEMYADSAFHIYTRFGNSCKQAYSRILQASRLETLGLLDSAFTQLYWANAHLKPDCDSLIYMYLYMNLSSVYLSLGDLPRIDSLYRIVVQTWNSGWEDPEPRLAVLTNLGISLAYQGLIDSSTQAFHRVLAEARSYKNREYIQTALSNLGTIKGMSNDLDSAYYFLRQSAEISLREEDLDNFIPLLINLAIIDSELGNHQNAMALLDSAYHLAKENKNAEFVADILENKAKFYAKTSHYKRAYVHLDSFTIMRDSLLNEERIRAVADMMEKYESEKKARQIQELELEKLDAQLENTRITSARNRFLYSGIGVLLVAIGLFTRLRYIRKSRAEIRKQKDVSEGLLLNILPESVADELKSRGYAEARQFDKATILFSDFKEFTSISELLSPQQLVAEINTCFKAFDMIITKYGIEKIKTIGDAYMAAGGIPEPDQSSPGDVVNAALEMQQFMMERRHTLMEEGKPAFEMRIGIHTGPVVAGIVGVKKFQYDIWGDTVNIASRMESASQSDKVNISEETYRIIKDNPDFKCISRGKISVKGKGEMQMYFVEWNLAEYKNVSMVS